MTHVREQPFEGHKSFPEPEPHSATQTSFVGTAQKPYVIPPQRVCPERVLTPVQRDTLHSTEQFGAFTIANMMHSRPVARWKR